MGILCCCFRKNDYYEDGSNSETRRILDNNPVGINDGDRRETSYSVTTGGYGGPSYGSTQMNGGQRQDDENNQSRLYNRVLDQLSARVIDISSIEKSGEQADLTDREHAIHKKLSTVRRSVVLESNKQQPATQSRVADLGGSRPRDPLPMDDYRLISNIAIKSASAVEHGFRIHNAEPFVVKFSES